MQATTGNQNMPDTSTKVDNRSDFQSWVIDGLRDRGLHIAVKRESGQWYALLLEFDITGCGETREEAVQEGLEMLVAYLDAHYEDGDSFEVALRPIPGTLRLRIELESALAPLARTLLNRNLDRLPFAPVADIADIADESTFSLPGGVVANYVHA
jgi:hypothetical protein